MNVGKRRRRAGRRSIPSPYKRNRKYPRKRIPHGKKLLPIDRGIAKPLFQSQNGITFQSKVDQDGSELNVVQSILQREEEVEAANKPGRHRDSDMQMKAFADHFGEAPTATLPPIPAENVTARPRLLGFHPKNTLEHQKAVQKRYEELPGRSRNRHAKTSKPQQP